MRILLVEDNEVYSKFLKDIVLNGDEEVEHVKTLGAALIKLQSYAPDAILLDLTLPDAQWPDSLKRVVAAHPEIPIICVTGDPSKAVEALSLGAEDYLYKPDLRREALFDSLRRAIDRKQVTRTLSRITEKFESLKGDLANERSGRETVK